MVREVTDAVLAAEAGQQAGRQTNAYPRDPQRVWVFPTEVPDGTWGANGRINTLADIVEFVIGDAEKARTYAQRRLSARHAVAVSS